MSQKSLLEREISPFKQVIGVLLVAIVFMGFSSLVPSSPYSSTNGIMPWVVICGMILFFAIINSILCLGASDGNTYWLHSIISFVILLVVGGMMAWVISGVSINDAGSVRWIYVVFTFGYLVFLSIVNFMKFLMKLAQRQDKGLRGEN
jgi:hypothetical protein